MVAEDSSVWPQVTRPPWAGGLGFSMKWNHGWAHEALEYISHPPQQRHAHHDMLTLGLLSAFTENFVLPFSHREAAGTSLLARMPGDRPRQLASLRLLYTYAWSHPGKKLLFMGDELASPEPWAPGTPVPWELAQDPGHGGMQVLVRDLNRLHRELPALHGRDFDHSGFEWIDCHDAARAVLAFVRRSANDLVVVALNFSDEVIGGYRLGVPVRGEWREILNSDSEYYGGGNVGNGGTLVARPLPWAGRPYSLDIVLPPLAGVLLRPVAGGGA
jgi:1,4-alpha-glucan branching enzyme